MLKFLQYCSSVLSFLRPHCSTMLSFFINFFLSLSPMLVSFPSLFSLLSHFSSVTPSHPNFFLSLSPSQPTLSPLQSKKYQKESLYNHIEIQPKKPIKNPTAITQKPNLKTKKSAKKNTQNLTKNTQKISFQNPNNQLPKYPEKTNKHRKIASKTQKISFQNTQKINFQNTQKKKMNTETSFQNPENQLPKYPENQFPKYPKGVRSVLGRWRGWEVFQADGAWWLAMEHGLESRSETWSTSLRAEREKVLVFYRGRERQLLGFDKGRERHRVKNIK